MADREWPREETCAMCGTFGWVWWWDARPYGYRCPKCADPEGYKAFCRSLPKPYRLREVEEGRKVKHILRKAAQ